jgi:NAD(P)-dependent dehydrogenase (short-subunit alcohol dehydrogenase family)
MCILISLPLLVYVIYRAYYYIYPAADIHPQDKYVLISGCDTGFGHSLAIELDKQGFHVFATVYNTANQASLANQLSPRASVLCLDITQTSQIDAVFQVVSEKTNTLHALVNNAGIDQDGLIDWITLDFMRKMMDVNFFGHVAMTKAFLPLLITKRDSRVVNLCSVAGFLAAPSMSSYCASKYALESFSDCLRREMTPWGLNVSIIEPGYMRTPIIEGHVQVMQQTWKDLSADVKHRWGEVYFKKLMNQRSNNMFIHFAENPNKVVHAMKHAVTSTAPHIRYRPGWQSSLLFFPLSMGPAWFTDLLMKIVRGIHVYPVGVSAQIEEETRTECIN